MPTQSPADHCCAVILSGGLNTRMARQNKAFLDVGGVSIIERLMGGLQAVFKEIMLVTRKPELYAHIPVRVVTDLYEARSSLTGIHAGLVHAPTDYIFVVPCDTPFLQPAVIRVLLKALEPDCDAVVPLLDEHYQPLCAVYSRRCTPIIETQLDRADYKIINFFDRINVKTIGEEEITAVDPELLSFFNVNTPEALEASRKIAEKQEK